MPELKRMPTKLMASAAYMSSHFRNYVVGGVCAPPPASTGAMCPTANGGIVPFDYSANNLIYAPKFSGSIYAEYTLPTSFGKDLGDRTWAQTLSDWTRSVS